MKVKMLTIYAGPSGVAAAGGVIEVPDAEAKALIDGGYAVADGEPGAKAKAGRGGRQRADNAGATPPAQTPAQPTAEQQAEKAKADVADLLEQAEAEEDQEVKARIIAEANKILQAAGLPLVEAGAQ